MLTVHLLLSGLALHSQPVQVHSDRDSSFFPLKVGNVYVYANMGGWKYNKIKGFDTLIITRSEENSGFTRYFFNNGNCWDMRDGNVVQQAATMGGNTFYNTLFCPVSKDTVMGIDDGCGIRCYINAKRIGTYKVGEIVFKDCYRYFFDSDHDSYFVVAHGIGLVEKFDNGKKSILINYALRR